MRYLESLSDGQTVGRVVMVAAFSTDLGIGEIGTFFTAPFQLDRIRIRSKRGFAIIQSDNDPYVPNHFGPELRDALAGRLIIKHAAKHMSDSDGCHELPEVVKEALVS